VKSYY